MNERIAPCVDASDDITAIIAMTAPPDRDPPGTISVLAHRPEMLTTFLPWARVLAREGVLDRRDHEILALRASINCRSAFEWGEHLLFARDAGLTDDEIWDVGSITALFAASNRLAHLFSLKPNAEFYAMGR